jgi:PAT family beta-lactamase induction signal transducer AmpG
MGAGFLPLGVFGSVMVVTVPQLLSADHVPEQQIAMITAIGIAPGFISLALAPLLDWRLPRRTYAIGLAGLGALCLVGSLLAIRSLQLLTAFLFVGEMAISLCATAVGGWFGELTPPDRKNALGAWLTVGNICGGGLTAPLAIMLLRNLPYSVGAGIVGLLGLAVLPLFFWLPCPAADKRFATEGFRAFARDLDTLLKSPSVRWALALFIMPCASFALTNTLGGLGRDFGASEDLVSLISGGGVVVAGLLGSLIIPGLARKAAPIALYLIVGGAGAIFTMTLLILPHTAASFGLAVLGENSFQAAAFALTNVITLRLIGHNNPLAATQFGLLIAASAMPLSYMQIIDGWMYGRGGVSGSALGDAMISGAACVFLSLLLWRSRRARFAE